MEIPSCFIKLDSLDSKFVLNGNFDHENTLPLWDFNAKNRNNFREFQVLVQKRKHEETVDAVSAKSANNAAVECKSYKCNMCDIDVPTMYRREHINSTIHRLNIEIADLVLQRIRTNLTLDVEDIADVKDDSTYFCDTCGTSVYVTEKKEHELTKMHVKLFVYEKFLKDFLDIYRNRESLDTVNFDYLAQSGNCVDVNSSSDVDDSDFERSNIDDSELAKTEIDDSQLERSELDDYEIASSEDDYEDVLIDNPNYDYAKIAVDRLNLYKVNIPHSSTQIEEPDQVIEPNVGTTVQNGEAKKKRKRVRTKKKTEKGMESKSDKLKRYYEILTRNMEKSSYKFSFENSDTVHITTMDKCVLQVSFDNFNGFYHKVGAMNYTQCRICRVMIEGSKYDHMFTDGHVDKMRIPLENKHCYRQIDVKYGHCVLCNDNFYDIEYHKWVASHVSALHALASRAKPTDATVNKLNTAEVENSIQPKIGSGTATMQKSPKVYFPTYKRQFEYPSHSAAQPNSGAFTNKVEDLPTPSQYHKSVASHESALNELASRAKPTNTTVNNSNTAEVDNSIHPKIGSGTATMQKSPKVYFPTYKRQFEYPSHSAAQPNSGAFTNKEEDLPTPSQYHKSVASHECALDALASRAKPTDATVNKLNIEPKIGSGIATMGKSPKVLFPTYKRQFEYPSHSTAQPNSGAFTNKVEDLPTRSLHYHFIPIDDKLVKCQICQSKWPNNEKIIQQHLKGDSHRIKYYIGLAIHQIEQHHTYLKCNLCNTKIEFHQVLIHTRDAKHVALMKEHNL